MQLKTKLLGLDAGRPVVIMHKKTAEALDRHVDERIYVKKNSKKIIAVIDIARHFVKPDEIIVSDEVVSYLNLKKDEFVEIGIAHRPESIFLIHKKLDCIPLGKEEIKKIISDIVNNALTEAEIAYFVSSEYNCRMSMQEIKYLTESIVETGQKLNLDKKKKKIIADKHSIGGVSGNRTTPIVVAICAAAGLTMPKTSSRAITTAAGTSDVIETIAKVDFSVRELKKIIEKAGACLVWGGSLGLAPADDKIIQVERLLKLDPVPQLLASIMAKKIAVGATHVLIDIPYGKSAKVSKKESVALQRKFLQLAKHFKIKMKCILTDGSQPIGNGIGPVLEMRDVLDVLRQNPNRPLDLEKKSIFLASEILELTGKAKKSEGIKFAKEILQSGKALQKFREIISAQKGNLNNNRLKPAKFSYDIKAKGKCKIIEIDNKKINALARRAGCPADKTAGLFLHKHVGDNVSKGEKILIIFSESQEKLKEAVEFYKKAEPIAFQ